MSKVHNIEIRTAFTSNYADFFVDLFLKKIKTVKNKEMVGFLFAKSGIRRLIEIRWGDAKL